jgi:hypothetical protein
MRISFPNLNKPAKIWIIPANTTVANIYSGPCEIAKATITTAIAPVLKSFQVALLEVTTPQQTLHKDQLTEINRLLKQSHRFRN